METLDPFLRLGAALGIGLLVGLERGWSTRADQPGTRTAGVRTFALSGLLGGVIGAIARTLGEGGGGLVFGLAFVGFGGVFALFCREENRAEGSFSATTAVAGMATFALAAYAVAGDTTLAVAGAVAMTALLALREGLHAWISRITAQELRSGLLLLAMTFIALPLLPDRTIGPFGGVNPREVWLIAIVLAAVSFFGYAVVRVVGETRGVLLAAAAGGLVSSTAVMLDSARQAAAGEGRPRLLAGGAMLATAMSLARAAAIVAVLNPAVFQVVWAPLAAAAAASVGAALLLAARAGKAGGSAGTTLKNPFDLKAVLMFALVLAAVQMVSRALGSAFGDSGAVVAAALAGIADIDAVTVSMARLAPASLTVAVAGVAVLVAATVNTLSKVALGIAVGRGWFAIDVAAASVGALLAGALAWMAAAWTNSPA